MWSEQNNFDLLENINVKSKFKDEKFMFFQLFPREGYVLRMPMLDSFLINEDTGEYLLDENGEKIPDVPYRTSGGATEQANYNFADNPKGYIAEKRTEDMILF